MGAGALNVNRSATLVLETPELFVTVTSITPAASAGEVAIIEPSFITVNELAATVPNRTEVAPENRLPEIVTLVPPVVAPLDVLSPVTAGGGLTNAKRSADEFEDVPELLVTVMSTVPTDSAGLTAVTVPSEFTVNDVAAIEPNLNAVTPDKLVPEIVTDVPPVVSPDATLRLVIEGSGAVKVN